VPYGRRYMLLAAVFSLFLLATLVFYLLAACVLYPDMVGARLRP
jgi:ATP/ADP translocase